MQKLSTLVPALVALLALAALPLAGRAQFAAQSAFATGFNPTSVTTADVNGDGKPDLLVANSSSNTVGVLLNTTTANATTASFARQTTFANGTNSGPTSVAAADVNGDGKPDLLVANSSSDNVGVLLNTTATNAATASFAAQVIFAAGSSPASVTAADVNGDGRPDLLVANFNNDNVGVLLNMTATGATTASFINQAAFSTGMNPRMVAVADINGDGRPDLLAANQSGTNASVLLNTTATGATMPSFATQVSFTTGSSPTSVATADVNGDGKPDLLVANSSSFTVGVLLNTMATSATMPSFAAQVTFATSLTPFSVTAADVNGDGKPDLLVANYSSNTVGVLLNTTATNASTASFAAQTTFSTGGGPISVTAADVNGDGRPDLLVANSNGNSNNVSVLLNRYPLSSTPGQATLLTATLFPNPTTGAFTLTLPSVPGAATATATLVNALGQVVNTRTLALAATGTTAAYAPAGLAAGVYVLRVQAGSQTMTLRLVVE